MAVYFIQVCDDGPIKIGYAQNPKRRLHNMQTGNPVRLRLLAITDGGESEERALHSKFAASRISGEWFAPTTDLMEFVASVPSVNDPKLRNRSYADVSTHPLWPEALKRAVTLLGGSKQLADKIGVTRSAVWQWRRVPAKHLVAIERALDRAVTRYELRPDIFEAAE